MEREVPNLSEIFFPKFSKMSERFFGAPHDVIIIFLMLYI